MKFEIIEIDRDYRSFVGLEIKEFETLVEANKWCTDNSYGGVDFFAIRKETVAQQS